MRFTWGSCASRGGSGVISLEFAVPCHWQTLTSGKSSPVCCCACFAYDCRPSGGEVVLWWNCSALQRFYWSRFALTLSRRRPGPGLNRTQHTILVFWLWSDTSLHLKLMMRTGSPGLSKLSCTLDNFDKIPQSLRYGVLGPPTHRGSAGFQETQVNIFSRGSKSGNVLLPRLVSGVFVFRSTELKLVGEKCRFSKFTLVHWDTRREMIETGKCYFSQCICIIQRP